MSLLADDVISKYFPNVKKTVALADHQGYFRDGKKESSKEAGSFMKKALTRSRWVRDALDGNVKSYGLEKMGITG